MQMMSVWEQNTCSSVTVPQEPKTEITECKHKSAQCRSLETAYNDDLNRKRLSPLKCAGPLQLVVTILHYNKCEEEKANGQ